MKKRYFVNEPGANSSDMKVWCNAGRCIKCDGKAACLAMDNSDEEYSTILICFSCLDKLKAAIEEGIYEIHPPDLDPNCPN